MFYNIRNSYQGTSFHIRNVADIYEKHNTRELITSFNRSSLCDGYKTMKRHSSDLAKHAVVHDQRKEWNITLSSHFSPSSFTVAAFDHSDKYTLSANAGVLDTAVTVFQEKPDKPLQRPFKSEVRLRNMIILKRLSCQGWIGYTETKNLKLKKSFSADKEASWSENKIKDHEWTELIMSCVQSQNPDNYVLPI